MSLKANRNYQHLSHILIIQIFTHDIQIKKDETIVTHCFLLWDHKNLQNDSRRTVSLMMTFLKDKMNRAQNS